MNDRLYRLSNLVHDFIRRDHLEDIMRRVIYEPLPRLVAWLLALLAGLRRK